MRTTSVPLLAGMGLVVLVLSLSAGVSLGAVSIPLETVWSVISNKLGLLAIVPDWSAGRESIIWDVRLPRVLLAAFVGAGLALVGAALQPATRNPLADPHLLGVSSGAAFGAILALLHVGMIFGLATVPIFAFLGALAATIIVMTVARVTPSASADRLVLSGVAVSFVVMASANLLIFLGDPRAAHTVVFWMLGGMGLAQWSHLIFPAAALMIGLVVLVMKARHLNALAMGDETALSLGVPAQRTRLEVFFVAALLTGVMVAFSGAIGFVGLMVPHIVRFVAGSDNLRVIPLSALAGAILLVWADIVARVVMAPEDMPIGVVTGLVGGMAFILLLRKRG